MLIISLLLKYPSLCNAVRTLCNQNHTAFISLCLVSWARPQVYKNPLMLLFIMAVQSFSLTHNLPVLMSMVLGLFILYDCFELLLLQSSSFLSSGAYMRACH